MPNFEAVNTKNYYVPIEALNVAGQPVALPSGDTFTVTNSIGATDSSLFSVGMMPDGSAPAVVINSAGHAVTSATETLTLTDSAGLIGVTLAVDVVADLVATELDLNVAAAVAVVPS
jgi:hypothetical protein